MHFLSCNRHRVWSAALLVLAAIHSPGSAAVSEDREDCDENSKECRAYKFSMICRKYKLLADSNQMGKDSLYNLMARLMSLQGTVVYDFVADSLAKVVPGSIRHHNLPKSPGSKSQDGILALEDGILFSYFKIVPDTLHVPRDTFSNSELSIKLVFLDNQYLQSSRSSRRVEIKLESIDTTLLEFRNTSRPDTQIDLQEIRDKKLSWSIRVKKPFKRAVIKPQVTLLRRNGPKSLWEQRIHNLDDLVVYTHEEAQQASPTFWQKTVQFFKDIKDVLGGMGISGGIWGVYLLIRRRREPRPEATGTGQDAIPLKEKVPP